MTLLVIVRGLSELQCWILRATLKSSVDRQRGLFYSEVKSRYFALPLRGKESAGLVGWVFAKGKLPGYNAASTSVSRAVKRLYDRGFVETDHLVIGDHRVQDTQIFVTPAGSAVAAAIEIETPSAFGFKPLSRPELIEIVKKAAQSDDDKAVVDRFERWVRERPQSSLSALVAALTTPSLELLWEKAEL